MTNSNDEFDLDHACARRRRKVTQYRARDKKFR